MMHRFTMSTAAFALLVGLGSATAQQTQQPAQPRPAPGVAQPSTEGRAPPAGDSQQQIQAERAMQSPSGKAGKEEPSSHAPTKKPSAEPMPISPQTVPSKFSERNARLDRLPIMAQPLPFSDAEKQRIYASVSETRPAPASDAVEPAHALPNGVEMHPFPKKITEEIPALGTLHYARFENKLLLVRAPNRIVVGVIEK